MSAGIILGSAAPTRLGRGTTRLPISGTIGANNLLIVGSTFAIQDPQTYFLLASIRPAAPEFDTNIALELYDETAGTVITSYPFSVGPSSDPSEQSFSFVLPVVNPANLYSLRITVNSGGNPNFALSLANPGFSLNVVLNGGAAGFLTGAAAPLVQVGHTVHLGTAVAPTTADALASVIWSPDAANHKALVLQAKPAQTANVLEVQNSAGVNTFSVPSLNSSTGIENFAAGDSAMIANLAGNYNTAVGFHALMSNTFDGVNAAFGNRALESNVGGDYNCAFGAGALSGSVNGFSNCAFGANAMGGVVEGRDSVAMGTDAGRDSSGSYNVIIGSEAGYGVAGNQNVIIGQFAVNAGVTGANNVVIGYSAALNITTGGENVILGANAEPSAPAASNEFIAGSSLYPVNNIYFGKGAVSALPTAYTINGTKSSALGVVGGDLLLAGGLAAQAADAGGALRFFTAPSGAGLTLSERLTILPSGYVGVNAPVPIDALSFGVAPLASATRALVNLTNTALVGGSASGTYVGANPAAAAADFINYQVTSVTKFKVDLNGSVFTQAFSANIVSTAVAYPLTASDYTVLANAVGAGFNVTLPNAVGNTGRICNVKKIDASANVVNVVTAGGLIDGAANVPIGVANQSLTFQSDGANWWIL